MKREFIILNEKDNVATALINLPKGFEISNASIEGVITCLEDIPKGHKVALKSFKEGDDVIKYGASIGRLTKDVNPGQLVHVNNLVSKRGKERGR